MLTNIFRLKSGAIHAWLLLPLFGLLFAAQANAAVTIEFVFVAPTATIDHNFTRANSTFFTEGTLPTGYKGAFITPQNQAAFRSAAPSNIRRTYDVLQSGQAMRNLVDQELQINGGRTDVVRFFLIDDTSGFAGPDNGMLPVNTTADGTKVVWPVCWTNATTNGHYHGYITLSEVASIKWGASTNWLAWEGVILHETSHSQFVGSPTKWSSMSIAYGGDGRHFQYSDGVTRWRSELLGDQPSAWNEGLGNFFSTIHNTPSGIDTMGAFWSSDDRRYLIESRSFLAGTSEVYNAPHTEESRPLTELSEDQRTGSYVWRHYRWTDVPGWYLLFTETTTEAFHVNFWQQVNGNHDQAMSIIRASLSDLWQTERKRYLTYEINRLALEMERFANTPDGQTARTAGRLTSSMFPFALLDILTHYGMSEQQYRHDYDINYPDRQPRAYTEYWRHRQVVRDLVMPMLLASPIRMQDAINAATRYFQQPATILAAAP